MSSAISSVRRCRAGVTSLEFGLIASGFLLFVLGAVQISLYLFTEQSLELLTGTVARGAIVGTVSTGCPTTLPSAIVIPPILVPANLSVCVTKTTPSGDIQIQVVSTYSFTFFLPILSGDSGMVSTKTTPLY